MKVYVVGAGPGTDNLLTGYAKEIIENSDMVLITNRLYNSLAIKNPNTFVLSIGEIIDCLISGENNHKSVAVVASGDVGFYSIASTLKSRLPQAVDLEFISGISSFQYLTAKLNMGYEDVKTLSLHGKSGSIVPYVCYNKKVFCLTGGELKVNNIIDDLTDAGLDFVKVTVGENLSSETERIVTETAGKLKGMVFSDLAVMLIENNEAISPYAPLTDSDFIRGNTPMTKECVRTVSIEALAICPTDTVYDIGAGTGSVSVCMARKAFCGTVYAIEKNADALGLIKANIEKHKAYNIKISAGEAPSVLENLPAPNKVFIGGSTGQLEGILDLVLSKNRHATILLNAVTIETLTAAVSAFEKFELNPQITCLNVSKAESFGSYHLMKAQNPVYIIKGAKK